MSRCSIAKTLDFMSQDDRTTAIGLARYAREYYDAALAADKVLGQREGYEEIAPPPVMFLVALSIELALKSYLKYSGMSLGKIKGLGHDLLNCWQEIKKKGVEEHVTLTDEDLRVLRLISKLHKKTELKYIRTGFKNFPVFGPLQGVTEKILNGICPLVGYK